MNQQRNPDDCPRCGTRVSAGVSHGIGARGEGERLPEPNQQAATCPTCQARLRRAVGSPWSVEERA